MDFEYLNLCKEKDHFSIPIMDKMLNQPVNRYWYCFFDGYLRYNQIFIALEDKEKTTFTCLYGIFFLKKMPFYSCNAPTTFLNVYAIYLS